MANGDRVAIPQAPWRLPLAGSPTLWGWRTSASPPPGSSTAVAHPATRGVAAGRGATCYLNALLQALYMTPELRDGLFSVDPRALHVDMVRTARRPCPRPPCTHSGLYCRPDGPPIGWFLVQRGRCRSQGLWQEAAPAAGRPAGAAAPVHHPPAGESRATRPRRPACRPTASRAAPQASIDTNALTQRAFNWKDAEGRQQHDVQVCITPQPAWSLLRADAASGRRRAGAVTPPL